MNEHEIPTWEQLTAYFDGELERDERLEMEQLLFENPEYAQALRDWKELRAEFQAIPSRAITGVEDQKKLSQNVMDRIFESVAAGEVDWDSRPVDLEEYYRLRESGAACGMASGDVGASAEWRKDFRQLRPEQRMRRWNFQMGALASVAALMLIGLFVSRLPKQNLETAFQPEEAARTEADSRVASAEHWQAGIGDSGKGTGATASPAGEAGTGMLAKGGDSASGSLASGNLASKGSPDTDQVMQKQGTFAEPGAALRNGPASKAAMNQIVDGGGLGQESLGDQALGDQALGDQALGNQGLAKAGQQTGSRQQNGGGFVETQQRADADVLPQTPAVANANQQPEGMLAESGLQQVEMVLEEEQEGFVVFETSDMDASIASLNQVLTTNGFGGGGARIDLEQKQEVLADAPVDRQLPAYVVSGDVVSVAETLFQFKQLGNRLLFVSRLPPVMRESQAEVPRTVMTEKTKFDLIYAQRVEMLTNRALGPSVSSARELQQLFEKDVQPLSNPAGVTEEVMQNARKERVPFGAAEGVAAADESRQESASQADADEGSQAGPSSNNRAAGLKTQVRVLILLQENQR